MVLKYFYRDKDFRASTWNLFAQVFFLSLYLKSVLSVLEMRHELDSFILCNLTMPNNITAVSSVDAMRAQRLQWLSGCILGDIQKWLLISPQYTLNTDDL